MGIDATGRVARRNAARLPIAMDVAIKRRVDALWKELGL
jgi:3-polyprenyl-4-hydroxybenzoate decarboxylase